MYYMYIYVWLGFALGRALVSLSMFYDFISYFIYYNTHVRMYKIMCLYLHLSDVMTTVFSWVFRISPSENLGYFFFL